MEINATSVMTLSISISCIPYGPSALALGGINLKAIILFIWLALRDYILTYGRSGTFPRPDNQSLGVITQASDIIIYAAYAFRTMQTSRQQKMDR